MGDKYTSIFDKVMIKHLKRLSKNKHVKDIISKMLDKIEEDGPKAGELLDSKLHIYEIKNKKPPIRLYFSHNILTNDIKVFEYEMKTNEKKQNQTIGKIKYKVLKS